MSSRLFKEHLSEKSMKVYANMQWQCCDDSITNNCRTTLVMIQVLYSLWSVCLPHLDGLSDGNYRFFTICQKIFRLFYLDKMLLALQIYLRSWKLKTPNWHHWTTNVLRTFSNFARKSRMLTRKPTRSQTTLINSEQRFNKLQVCMHVHILMVFSSHRPCSQQD
jgi:hypothetical protein